MLSVVCRKKGQLTKQLIKLFPILCGLLALALTAAVVLLNTNIKHWKAEHQRVQGMYDRKGEDAQRLQVRHPPQTTSPLLVTIAPSATEIKDS